MSGLSESEFHKIREAAGLRKDVLENGKIFAPSKKGRDKISVKKDTGVDGSLSSVYVNRLQDIGLYANYLAKFIIITELVITSTSRTDEKQAKLMVPYLMNIESTMYPTVRGWLYKNKQSDGNTYYEQRDKGIITESEFLNIAEKLALKHVKANRSDYKHVSDEEGKVFDIDPNESSHSGNDRTCYNKSITILEGNSLQGNSKLYGESGENAYHIVLK